MKCCIIQTIKCLFLTLFTSAVLYTSTVAEDTEECGLINAEQFRNKQKTTQIDEFPWMARIAFNKTQTSEILFKCQAILINQQHLLTVAHCIKEDYFEEPYAVVLGDWNASNSISEKDCNDDGSKCSTPLLIDIDEIIVHPYLNTRSRQNDISLLRLTQAVTYTNYIRPICLPSNDVSNKEFGSEELMLTGWLFTLRNNVWGHKRKMPVVVFNQHDCRRKYSDVNVNRFTVTDKLMCAITCDEDGSYLSGSALMDVQEYESLEPRNVHLVGIVAYGIVGCVSRVPDIFIRVDRYLDWIKENIS